MQFSCNLSAVTNGLNFSSIFTGFFMLWKYWNEPQIITKIVCEVVYSMSINIYIFLCTDYSQGFFLSLVWSNVAKDLIWKKKMFDLVKKYQKNGRVEIICNTFNAKWSLLKLFWLITIIIALIWRSVDNFDKRTYFCRK